MCGCRALVQGTPVGAVVPGELDPAVRARCRSGRRRRPRGACAGQPVSQERPVLYRSPVNHVAVTLRCSGSLQLRSCLRPIGPGTVTVNSCTLLRASAAGELVRPSPAPARCPGGSTRPRKSGPAWACRAGRVDGRPMRRAEDAPPAGPGPPTSGAGEPWWKRAVFYQIYPRSFADSDGDGVGDLAGIRAHLSHLAWLGVDALWISPFYRSPMVDFGYDVSDYCDVDPLFGTLEEFDRLVEGRPCPRAQGDHRLGPEPHLRPASVVRRRGVGPDSAHRNWYVWREPGPDGSPPNNWVASFDLSAPAWTFDQASGQWYLHLFDAAQPDLNWDEPAVVAPCTTCSASGSTGGWTGSGRTSSTASARTPTCPTTHRRWPGSPTAPSTTCR